jgi:hypothetical protein
MALAAYANIGMISKWSVLIEAILRNIWNILETTK